MKSWTRAIVTLALALSAGAQAANLPLTIALLLPASDPQLSDGVDVREGAMIALEEVKPSFARLGYDLKLQIYDDKRSPEEGVAQAKRILNNPEAIMVIGAINSSVTLTASVVLAPQHMAMLSPKSTNPMVTERGLKNINRMVPRDDAQAQAVVTSLPATRWALRVPSCSTTPALTARVCSTSSRPLPTSKSSRC